MWKLLQVVVDCFLLCFLMFPVSYPLFHGLTVDGLSKLYATANVFGSTKKPLRDLTSQQARQKKSPDPDQPDSKCLLSHLTCAICTVWGPSCYRCLLVFSTNVSNYDSTFVKRRVKLFSLHMINVYQCQKETTKFGPVLVKKSSQMVCGCFVVLHLTVLAALWIPRLWLRLVTCCILLYASGMQIVPCTERPLTCPLGQLGT